MSRAPVPRRSWRWPLARDLPHVAVRTEGDRRRSRDGRQTARGACIAPARIKAAERYAKRRHGRISFAVLDECGRLVGSHRYRVHYSASVVKVMLMVAYLNRRDVRDREPAPLGAKLLGPMIKKSTTPRQRGLRDRRRARIEDVAGRAKMRHFTTMPTWGGSEITAGDQASFVLRLERYVPKRHEDYALGLMARVIDPQRWGMPRVKPQGWKIRLKGGWSGATSARAGASTRSPCSRTATGASRLAILTRLQPVVRLRSRDDRGRREAPVRRRPLEADAGLQRRAARRAAGASARSLPR